MSHRFRVDPELLRTAAGVASRGAASASRGSLKSATGLGDGLVEQAAARVVSNWSNGLDHLHTDIGEVVARLKATAKVYEEGDTEGKDAADKVGGGMPSR
jgi:hypothetical protein